jgi:parallel beta-helix repeat protein
MWKTVAMAVVAILVPILFLLLLGTKEQEKIPVSYRIVEDDKAVDSSINPYILGKDLVIEYKSSVKPRIEGSVNYTVLDDRVIVYNYSNQHFRLIFGYSSDVYEFGNVTIENTPQIIDYDANLKIVQNGSITIVAPNEIVCTWSDPNSLWKDCEVVIEVNNSDTKNDLILKGDTLLAKFLKDVQNFTVYTTYDYTLFNDTILNRACFDSLNATPEEKDEILRNKSICFYNYTRKNFYNFKPTTKLDKIYKNSVIGIKLVFKSPIVADAGVYLKNHFNFTLLSDYNITLDPTISACSVLDTAYGVYTLTADIIDSTATYCMNISANHVILDCQGHTIDGVDSAATYGIYVYRSSVTTTNVTIKNCVVTDWNWGIDFYYSYSNNLSNITANSNYYYGIASFSSDYNTLTNISANSNYYGIRLDSSDYATIKDSKLINSTYADVLYQTDRTSLDCHSNFTNVIGTDNKPIVFYNTSTTIKNWNNNASEIILCGADNSVIDNVTMSHTNVKNNGLFLVATNLTNVSNSFFNNTYHGIDFYYSNSNNLSNIRISYNSYGFYFSYSNFNNLSSITANSNSNYGIYLYSSNSNTLSNITANSNSQYGIYFDSSDYNNLSNITANSNYYGIYLYSSSSNTIKNSIIQGNSRFGIYLYSAGNTAPNLIYNNLFNNTNNFYFTGIIFANNWNTTRQSGTRIYSPGTEIGGNYWTNSAGNGYSDTCTDADKDGFCDSSYTLNANGPNIDYLPLSNKYSETIPPTYSLNSTNSTLAGTPVSHNLFWQDNAGLSYAIFSFDNCTGSLQNITGMALSGTSAWSNFTVGINSTVGCTIRWCVYANDTSNNWNGTSCLQPFSYTTTSAAVPQVYERNLSISFTQSVSTARSVNMQRELSQYVYLPVQFGRYAIIGRTSDISISTITEFLRNTLYTRDFSTSTSIVAELLRNTGYTRETSISISTVTEFFRTASYGRSISTGISALVEFFKLIKPLDYCFEIRRDGNTVTCVKDKVSQVNCLDITDINNWIYICELADRMLMVIKL